MFSAFLVSYGKWFYVKQSEGQKVNWLVCWPGFSFYSWHNLLEFRPVWCILVCLLQYAFGKADVLLSLSLASYTRDQRQQMEAPLKQWIQQKDRDPPINYLSVIIISDCSVSLVCPWYSLFILFVFIDLNTPDQHQVGATSAFRTQTIFAALESKFSQ